MAFGWQVNRMARASIAPAIFFAITAYFGWNATRGAHGLVAYAQRQVLLQKAETDHAAAQKAWNKWETRVSELRANHLELDMLDQRSRAMLNLADPKDVIVLYGPKDRLFQTNGQ